MKEKTQPFARVSTGVAGLILLLVVIGAVNLILANLRLRHDFTADKLYTLSAGSRAVLGKLPNDVTLKYYFSRSNSDVPMFVKSYADEVEDLLKEYALASKGRVVLETYDPKIDSDEEEWAQRYGLEAQPTGMFTLPLYFGVVASSGEREEVLPALSPHTEATLEYELTRLISRVANPVKPVIGVLSALSVMGQPPNPQMMMPPRDMPRPWVSMQELQRDFDVRTVEPDTEQVDDAITTLLVVHPKALSDKTLFALDQFVMRGGRLIACVDPFSVADFEASNQNQMAMFGMGGGQGPSTLGRLFDAWGVGFDTGKLVADMRAVTRLNAGGGRLEESPIFLSLGAEHMNADDLLTAQLDQVMLPFAGALTDATGDDVTFEPLIRSSDAACLVDASGAQFGLQAIRSQLKPDGLRHVLAARLTGAFKSAFPEGAPRDEAETSAVAEVSDHLAACTEPNTIVVVADTDFLADRFCVRMVDVMFGYQAMQPANDNLALLANAIEKLSGSSDLLGIRSRGRSARPFLKVDKIEAGAMLAWQAEEDKLNAELENTRRQLAELRQQKGGPQKLILSPEQEQAIAKFRQREVEVKAQLRQVSKNLRRDIEVLGVRLKVLNIAAVPLLVIILGVWRGLARRQRS